MTNGGFLARFYDPYLARIPYCLCSSLVCRLPVFAARIQCLFFSFVFLVKNDKTCACIVTHTYKQIRKLWENPEKPLPGSGVKRGPGQFRDDMDRSTSSSTGS